MSISNSLNFTFLSVFDSQIVQATGLGRRSLFIHNSNHHHISVAISSCSLVWQYGLWSFQTGGTKLERFLPKNQHTERKLLNFENWINGGVRSFQKTEF